LTCWNAAEAARRAGYGDKASRQIGDENLSKPYIQEYIEKRISEKAMSADEVLLRLGEIARGSLKQFTKTRDDDIWPDLTAAAAQENFHLLKKIKPKRRVGGKPGDEWVETEVEIEIHDPLKALELLGKHHKLFTDKTEHSGKVNTTPSLNVIINGTEPSSKTGDSIPVEGD
jgi:phage terminase small subunit